MWPFLRERDGNGLFAVGGGVTIDAVPQQAVDEDIAQAEIRPGAERQSQVASEDDHLQDREKLVFLCRLRLRKAKSRTRVAPCS